MCLLFIYYNERSKGDEYRLVIVNGRDEFWDRPTAVADFWGDTNDQISGIDLKTGIGTWFGISKHGKIGSLLNILQPNLNPNARSRGSFVPDYLTSDETPSEFMRKFSCDADKYNLFNLVLAQISKTLKISLYGYSNWTESEWYVSPTSINPDGVNVFGNCTLRCPWKKVLHAKDEFEKVINIYKAVPDRQLLVNNLLTMVQDKSLNYPDPVLQRQGRELDSDVIQAMSSVFVHIPSDRYGTRTHTIFLMDSFGECEYIEKTMHSSNLNSEDVYSWDTNTHHFKMCSTLQ